ncbi:MAG TPA: hypothetical protein ENK53_03415 [Thiotrichales bacterium]|nr:hypothetical protein [Thiotrichales bacterium]
MLTVLADDWTPARLFRPGDAGGFWDFHPQYCRQNSDGTGAVAVGQPVGWVKDLSGNGNHLVQATSAKKPVLRQDPSGYFYLDFDGVDDHIDLAAYDLLKFLNGGTLAFSALGQYDDITALGACCSNWLQVYRHQVKYGGNNAAIDYVNYQSPLPSNEMIVVSVQSSLSSRVARKNGVQIGANTNTFTPAGNVATVSVGSYQDYRYSNCNMPAYCLISRLVTGAELTRLEHWLARRAGITL